MQGTTLLTGMLPFVLLASAALTAPLAAFLLWLYRRAVLRSMASAAGGSPAAAAPVADFSRPALTVRTFDPRAPSPPDDPYLRGRRVQRRVAIAYALAGLAYAAVFTTAWTIWVSGDGFAPGRTLWFLAIYWWPTVLVLGLVVVTGHTGRLVLAGGYALALAVLGVWVLRRNPAGTPYQLLASWVSTNAAETALLLAFLARRIRAVGPLVLTLVTAGVAGAVFLFNMVGLDEALLRRIVDLGDSAGLGAVGIIVAMHVAGFAPLAVLGWWAVRRLAAGYQRKLLSDETILAASVMLPFGLVQSISLVFVAWPLIATGLVAAAAWRAVARIGIHWATSRIAVGPTLLLLRVFALGRRSQRLFDALSARWLRTGSLALIAGPDLATSTVEPHEFLDFVSGKLSRQFVRTGPDLERRLAALDTTPDRDGRFRTTEFFCHADTWQETMRRLARRCDVVLMDLRGFHPRNAGCIYEIGELLGAVPLARTVFLIDRTTDEPFLRATLDRLWRAVPAGSPNLEAAAPEVRLFVTERATPREVDGLLRLLLAGSAEPTGGRATRDALATA